MELFDRLMKKGDFTPSERAIVDVILEDPEILTKASSSDLAKLSYTSASTVVRLCRKLGFSSYGEFRVKILAEVKKEQYDRMSPDANYPFKKGDSLKEIVRQLTRLQAAALEDTLELVDEEALRRAIGMLSKAEVIRIYGSGINLHLAYDFAYKMERINRVVQVSFDNQQLLLSAASRHTGHCALVISYSGESTASVQYARLLKKAKTPYISITSTGENTIARYASERLYIATMEKQFSKLGPFSSCTSISAVLNYLYGGIFSLDYEENCRRLISRVVTVTDFRSANSKLKEDI